MLSITADITLKIDRIDIQNILDKIHGLRENLLYMLAFEKLTRNEQQSLIEPILNDDE